MNLQLCLDLEGMIFGILWLKGPDGSLDLMLVGNNRKCRRLLDLDLMKYPIPGVRLCLNFLLVERMKSIRKFQGQANTTFKVILDFRYLQFPNRKNFKNLVAQFYLVLVIIMNQILVSAHQAHASQFFQTNHLNNVSLYKLVRSIVLN